MKNPPLDNILPETDSPVLGATPEKRNEPANIITSLAAIAAIKSISRQEVTEAVARKHFAPLRAA